MNYLEKYRLWTTNAYFDEETKRELLNIKSEAEIKDRFYKDLEFGTGGLRGLIGAGTNRINRYTVRKASQGLANYILMENGEDKGVVIAYDSRKMSPEFALEAALCFCANGIQTYLFEGLRPTPELSYAVRKLGCISGLVITASHNPAEYNGYKVYWEDGAQITYPKDSQIIEQVNKIVNYSSVHSMSEKDAMENKLLHKIGKELDEPYLMEIKKLSLHPEVVETMCDKIKIVYTPLHGTGNVPVRSLLKEMGFKQVFIVPEQENPDGTFPTVPYPNPEDERAFTLALDYAKELDADIILATDPDADRLGIYVKDTENGEYRAITGNMSGVLICEYILSQRKILGKLPDKGAVVTTIVTTDMAKAVAKEYNMKCIETLTGFKYIGEQIKLFEQEKNFEYMFGFEESYGCLIGTYARDKDAVSAVAMLCEAAAFYKEQGLSLWDQMQRLYYKYGYYMEGLKTVTLKGEEGEVKINKIMEHFRRNPPIEIGNFKVESVCDYMTSEKMLIESGQREKIDLPVSNVLYFNLSDSSWCCVRPSGTEPKIKFYMGVKGDHWEDAGKRLQSLIHSVLQIADL